MKLIALIIALFCLNSVQAKLVQILHTNDVHSYFDHSDHNKKTGGYARLKTLIDKYKAAALEAGIKTIVVDAGDFSEGHMFYMANYARRSFDIQNQMGYDVVVMGNHDYLMGTDELDNVLADSKPNYALLGANIEADSRYTQINHIIRPYHEMEIDGIKIAFLGLTTNEIVFKWRLHNGKIKSPIKVGKKYDKILKKKRKNHVVIGLTHLGLKRDKKLIRATSDIDLIVGGHSHHFLHEPMYEKNKDKKIFQLYRLENMLKC